MGLKTGCCCGAGRAVTGQDRWLGWGGRPGSGVGSDWEVTRGSVLEEVHAVLRLRAGRKGRLDPGGSRGAQRRKQ